MRIDDFWTGELEKPFDNVDVYSYPDYGYQYRNWQRALDEQTKATPTRTDDPNRQQQFQQPATAHYHDHFFEPWAHPGDGEAYTVELARFPVPEGAIGIVRKLNQWVSGDFTRSDNWGNPFTGTDVDDYLWSLRLVPFTGLQGARLISTQQRLPGSTYPDFPQWRYLWFLPHAAGSDLNLVVPGGYSLQFFVRTTALQTRDEVFGRIVGYWQSSAYTVEAGLNARKGF